MVEPWVFQRIFPVREVRQIWSDEFALSYGSPAHTCSVKEMSPIEREFKLKLLLTRKREEAKAAKPKSKS